jgi:hypothetical protein
MHKLLKSLQVMAIWLTTFSLIFQTSFCYANFDTTSSENEVEDYFYDADGLPLNTVEILDKLDFNYDVFSALSPDGDFPDDYAEDFKELYILMVSQGFLPVKTIFDLDKIVGDPFKLERKTIRKILRLPERLKFQMVRYLFSHPKDMKIENHPNAHKNADPSNSFKGIRVDPDATKILPQLLERSFYGILQEEELIDLGVFIISKHPKFTKELWENLKKTITKHDILFAVVIAVGVLALDFFTDRIGLGRRGWFFINKGNRLRLGWYAKIWNLNYTLKPGAQIGLRMGYKKFEAQSGIYGRVEDEQLRVEQMITTSLFDKWLKPLGWMLSTSFKGKWTAMHKTKNRVNNLAMDGYITARKFDLKKPGGGMIVTRLKGSTNNYGSHSTGLSVMYGDKKRMLSLSSSAFFKQKDYITSQNQNLYLGENYSLLDDVSFSEKYNSWGHYSSALTEKNIMGNKGKDLRVGLYGSNIGKPEYRVGTYATLNNRVDTLEFMMKFNYVNKNLTNDKRTWDFGLFAGGSFDGGASIQRDHLIVTCENLKDKLEMVNRQRRAVEDERSLLKQDSDDIMFRVLSSNSQQTEESISKDEINKLEEIINGEYKSVRLNKNKLWLGIYRLYLKDELNDYYSTVDQYEIKSEEELEDTFCSNDPDFFNNIEKEIDKETYGAENHSLYQTSRSISN